MNPLAIKALAGVGLLAIAFGAGWTANGWRLSTELAEVRAAHSDEAAQAARDDLALYKSAAEKIHEAAAGAQVDLAAVNAQLAAIRKGQKNAPPPPLPADCKPGPVRLRNLAETAAAADKAIAGSVSGK
jgi:hypothetical protein